MFCFGSVLIWAIMRGVLPNSATGCTLFGIASSVVLIRTGKGYLDYLDALLPAKSN